jgi:hypothetical protein
MPRDLLSAASLRLAAKSAAAAAMTAVFLFPLREMSVFVTLPASLAIYAAAALALRVISTSDLRALGDVVRPRAATRRVVRANEEVA